MKFYVCKHCGKVITILNNVNVPTICCGAPMEELKANTVDAAVEKHVPFVTTVGGEIIIKVGEEKHPMSKEHYISFVAIETNQGMFIHNFNPEDEPEVKFTDEVKILNVYAYCNIHGLWKKEL